MKYKNPIVRGFYPDPSVCFANGKYYMVCSSFQYFPGVPLFESEDLVNWKQLGHVLTRKSQVKLEKINSSGGVFAPTIRFNNGRFYMVTTNDTTHENFYVYTDNIYGEWSEPIRVDQGGIDPSLLFDGGKTYFISNGTDGGGKSGIIQCEIDIESGQKLTEGKCIWSGSGGRYLESPHMYKIGDWYYLMAAEGGTEYGHMITYARSKNVWGEWEPYKNNPVLTNRNKAPFIIQGIGHGDLIQDRYGDWHIICLGFRQIHQWMAYHTLGREVFMIPVSFDENGWFTAGFDGTCAEEYEIKGQFGQEIKRGYTFENTDFNIDWCYLRHPYKDNYKLFSDHICLIGSKITLNEADSPTFIGIRQRDFNFELTVKVTILKDLLSSVSGEAGIAVYSCENEHYDLAVNQNKALLRLNIGGARSIEGSIPIYNEAELLIKGDNLKYGFFVKNNGREIPLGSGASKYLSSEVSGGFTGVVIGLYAVGDVKANFSEFNLLYL